jgi:hypothetical protein
MPAQDSILLLVFRTAAMVFVAIVWMPGMFGRPVRGRRLRRLGVGRLRRCEMWLGRVHRLRLRL